MREDNTAVQNDQNRMQVDGEIDEHSWRSKCPPEEHAKSHADADGGGSAG